MDHQDHPPKPPVTRGKSGRGQAARNARRMTPTTKWELAFNLQLQQVMVTGPDRTC